MFDLGCVKMSNFLCPSSRTYLRLSHWIVHSVGSFKSADSFRNAESLNHSFKSFKSADSFRNKSSGCFLWMSHWIGHSTDSFKNAKSFRNETPLLCDLAVLLWLCLELFSLRSKDTNELTLLCLKCTVSFSSLMSCLLITYCTCNKDISDITFELRLFGWLASTLIRK